MSKVSSETTQRHGHILTPDGWVRGAIEFSSRVIGVQGFAAGPPAAADGDIILPGFIDLHVHGGGGADVMDGADAIDVIARTHARHGTTSLLATTVTANRDDLEGALRDLGRAVGRRTPEGSRVLGVHLEGPYINAGRLGAQPPASRPADIAELRHLHALAPVRIVTLAPELAGHLPFVRQLEALGIVVQCGHTAGSYEDGVAALMAGVKGFTHLFNAMTPLHHREPGMVGAALAHASAAEIIPDLVHVHPGAIRVALRAIPRLYCVTDSTAAAGMPDGPYRLGTHVVTKCLGGVRLADGTLAGSSLTMDMALRNLVDIGLELQDASQRLSTFAADHIGSKDRGRLAAGAWADIVVLAPDLRLKAVYVEGSAVEHVDA